MKTIFNLFFLLFCIHCLNATPFLYNGNVRKKHIRLSETELKMVNHLKNSINQSDNLMSKLNIEVLKMKGMSDDKSRHLLNNLCSMENTNYLEIGTYTGSTLISALFDNEKNINSAVAIDIFKYGGYECYKRFINNTRYFLPKDIFSFYYEDSFFIDKNKTFKFPVNIYFYDGDHSAEAQKKAFTYFNEIFANCFVAVIDDWNQINVRQGTFQAFDALNYVVLYERDLIDYYARQYAVVIRKK